jgi:uncharacterized phiE125 gp8 family phage protein
MAKPAIDLTTAKAHLRVEHDFDDTLIGEYLAAAIDRTLAEIGLAGVLEGQHVTESDQPRFGFLYPVAEIVSVEKRNAAGAWVAVPEEEWTLSGTAEGQHSIELAAQHLPGSWYRVTWEAGLSPLPAWFRVAVLFLVGHYYENRSAVVIGATPAEVPMGFVHLTKPHRRWFFA